TLDGGITISLIDGGIQFRGEINSTVRDRTKGDHVTATMLIPVKAQVAIGEIQIPVQIPHPR
ncbi:MAG: hypothetical protein QOF61_1372, partial [Acidobacteriota bacterium]|nr:hypothetical protein [Acidobacteriota bacterium]